MNELEVGGLEIDEDSYKTNEKLTEQVLTLPRQFHRSKEQSYFTDKW